MSHPIVLILIVTLAVEAVVYVKHLTQREGV